MNMETGDFRVILLYEFKLGHTAAEAARNICKAFGDGSVNERTIRRWFAKFSAGDTDLENVPRGRPPSVIGNDVLKHTVEGNPYQTVKGLSAQLNTSASTVSRHLKCIGKVKSSINGYLMISLSSSKTPTFKTYRAKIEKLGYDVLPHPPYSPDISPTDYHLFRNLDNFVKGKLFENDDQVKSAFSDFVTLQSSEFFSSGIKMLVSRWENCVEKER